MLSPAPLTIAPATAPLPSEREAQSWVEGLGHVCAAIARAPDARSLVHAVTESIATAIAGVACGVVAGGGRGHRAGPRDVPVPREIVARAGEAAASIVADDRRSWASPLPSGGSGRAVLWCAAPAHQRLDPAAISLLEATALQMVLALDRVRLIAALAEIADTDPLTRLTNRRAWRRAALQAISAARRHGTPLWFIPITLADLARFRGAVGDGATDETLRALAGVWRRIVPDPSLLARLEGGRFVAAASVAQESEAVELARALADVAPAAMRCHAVPRRWRGESDPEALLAPVGACRDREAVASR
jgi:GGDEF domain-containing protein